MGRLSGNGGCGEVAKELISLNDEQMIDTRLLTLYRESMDETAEEPNDAVVGEVYRELGLAFSSATLRRFDEVEAFHRTLLGNRRRFIELLEQRIAQHRHGTARSAPCCTSTSNATGA